MIAVSVKELRVAGIPRGCGIRATVYSMRWAIVVPDHHAPRRRHSIPEGSQLLAGG